ncbi:SET domain-containing protein SmydA-8 [Ochlerotatus camptorhynchus]|uniref:SET domain-containing protein SmydA-8 n=1 Tax=Ochlerotatus camptorhynchus TaxID=644619 RepID=UPI0031DB7AFE
MTADNDCNGGGQCAVCGIPAGQRCAGCQQVSYCGRDHQRHHWKAGHRGQCRCCKISRNKTLGRHLTATRPIRRGELIYTDAPLLLGPKISSLPLCLGCHRDLAPLIESHQQNFHHCRRCGWPLCGPGCETASQHVEECRLLASPSSKGFRPQINLNREQPERKESAYCVVVPLRALLLKRNDPQRYRDGFLSLESHIETRIQTPLYAVMKSNLIPFVRNVLGMQDQVPEEEELLQIAGILDTNCYDVRLPERGIKIRALYELGAMMSHHCRPNTRHYFDDELRLVVVATVDIPKDEVISISYAQPLQATIQRRYAIQQAKCFQCGCDRCRDPTEFQTYAGSIICPRCAKEKVVALDPLDVRSEWQCKSRKCSYRESALDAIRRSEHLQATIMALARGKSPCEEYEHFLTTHQSTLHRWNTNVLQVKYALTQLYGRRNDRATPPESDLRRKVELCQDLLEVANRLEPGLSLFREKLLVELRDALLILRNLTHSDSDHVEVQPSSSSSSSSAIQGPSPNMHRQSHRINSSGANTGKSMAQLLEDVVRDLAEMEELDPTMKKKKCQTARGRLNY